MRVLIVSQYFWPENFRINDLAEGLVARGHTVSVLTGMPNYPGGKLMSGYGWRGPYTEQRNGIRIMRVPLIPRGKGGGIALLANYLSFVVSASFLCLWRCRETYSVVFAFQPSPVTVGIPARLLAARHKAPLLFWVQDLWPETLSATGVTRSLLVLRGVRGLVRWIYKGCALVLVQAETFFAPVHALNVPREKIRYFPNSAEAFYTPQKDTPWDGPTLPEGFRVMFAGNLGTAQSLETLLDAAALLRDNPCLHWIIVGDGRMRAWLEAEIEQRQLSGCVHVMGRYPAEAMPGWFAQADAMLVTLKKDPVYALTIPSKIQSYMACGRPIIAALDGVGADIVSDAACGYATPAEDVAALADAVQRMQALSVAERDAMGEKALQYFAQHFEREKLLDSLEQWMKEVIQ